MVSSWSIFFITLSIAIEFLFPIALAIFFYKKERNDILTVFIGALTFLVFQVFTRIPLLAYIQTTDWFMVLYNNYLPVVALILALSAGLFEETGRYVAYKLFMKKKLQWKNGVALGIGHGGIESMYIGLVMVNTLVYSIWLNSGALDSIIGPFMPADQLEGLKNQLINTTPAMFGISGLERILAICIHLGLSLVVLWAVKKKKPVYLLYSILLHTIVNFPIPLIMKYMGAIWSEVYVAVCAAVALAFVFKSKKLFSASSNSEALSTTDKPISPPV